MGMVIPLVSSNLCGSNSISKEPLCLHVYFHLLCGKTADVIVAAERQIIQKYICQHWGKNDKIISYKRFLVVAVKETFIYLYFNNEGNSSMIALIDYGAGNLHSVQNAITLAVKVALPVMQKCSWKQTLQFCRVWFLDMRWSACKIQIWCSRF